MKKICKILSFLASLLLVFGVTACSLVTKEKSQATSSVATKEKDTTKSTTKESETTKSTSKEKETTKSTTKESETTKSTSKEKETTKSTTQDTFEVTVSIPETLALETGDNSDFIEVTVTGKDASKADDYDKVWTSSDEEVITVSNGVVTAVSAGTATINVTINGVESNSMTVTVTDPIVYTGYAVKHYFYNSSTSAYVEDEDLRETYSDIAVGTEVSAQYKTVDGYLPMTAAEGTALSGDVIADNGLTLKLFYNKAVPISFGENDYAAYWYSLSSGPTYGNAGVQMEMLETFEGKNDVAKINFSDTACVIRIVGQDVAYLQNNNIVKLVMSFYVTSDFTMERLYETFYYSTEYGPVGLRNNSGNLMNNGDGAIVRMYDKYNNRIYDVTEAGWYTLEFNLDYKQQVLDNNGNGKALNVEMFVNDDNKNKPFYIADAHFSTEAMDSIAPIKVKNDDVNMGLVSFDNQNYIIGSSANVLVTLESQIGGRNNVYKATSNTENGIAFLRLYGMTKAELDQSGYSRLKFDIYVTEEDSYPTVFTADGIGATLNTNDTLSFKTKLFIRNSNGELIDKVVTNEWCTVEIDITGCTEFVELLHDHLLDFRLRVSQNKSIYLDNVELVKTANYTVEYYLINSESEYELDDFETETLKDSVGTTVVASPREIEGFMFSSENTNNVLSGTVLADGSLVLKLYYDLSNITTYNVEVYKYDSTTSTYVKDTDLSTVVNDAEIGKTVSAEYASIDGYLPMTSAEGTLTSGTVLADGALTLKLYYNEAAPIAFGKDSYSAYLYPLGGGPTYGNANLEFSNVGTYQGKNNVYKVLDKTGSSVFRIVGQNNVFLAENEIKKLSMDIYVTNDFTLERLYEILYYIDQETIGLRLNSGNLIVENNGERASSVRMYDQNKNRIYDFTGEGWVTLEIDLAYKNWTISNNGNGKAINVEFYVNENNADIPFYIANAHFSTESMNVGTVKIESEKVDACLTSVSEWQVVGIDERAYKEFTLVNGVGGKDNVYKVESKGSNANARLNSFLRIYGSTKDELAQEGITKLCFWIYCDDAEAYPTTFADSGTTLNSGDVANSGGNVVVKNANMEIIDQVAIGEWCYVEISITTCETVDLGIDGTYVNFKLRLDQNKPIYIYAPELK